MKTDLIVGAVKAGGVAKIKLYDQIDKWSAQDFIWQFDWLVEQKPSKIQVLINSGGGSVMAGISIFSTIQNSEIEVECINDGMAASIASVIWCAGDTMKMRDYSFLMIHNPFMQGTSEGELSADDKAMIESFRNQIKTIYQRRFGFTAKQADDIMNGEGELTETYIDCKKALELGMITKKQIIKTPPAIKNEIEKKISNNLKVNEIVNVIDEVLSRTEGETPLKPTISADTTLRKGKVEDSTVNINKNTQKKMNEETLQMIQNALGISEPKEADIVSHIQNLKADKEKAEKTANDLQIKLQGAETNVTNLNKELDEVKASLKVYQDAEKAEKEAAIEKMVDDAITAGKIDAAAKEQWIESAKMNFELAKNTLDSITGTSKISDEIANDKDNQESVKDAMKTAEEKVEAKVKEILGDDFTFRKLND